MPGTIEGGGHSSLPSSGGRWRSADLEQFLGTVRHSLRSGARASRSYPWPATHRQGRVHTSQPRLSRPTHRGDPSGVAGCVHDQPSPNSAQIVTSPNRSNASWCFGHRERVGHPHHASTGPWRLEIVGSRASCDSRNSGDPDLMVRGSLGRKFARISRGASQGRQSDPRRVPTALHTASQQLAHGRRLAPTRRGDCYATPRRLGGTRPSWFRELMSSFRKTLCKWYWTVRGLMNSLAPISGLEKPSLASRAICAS